MCCVIRCMLLLPLAAQLASGAPLPPWTAPCHDGVCRPSFLVIGGGKCGTSALYAYLNAHPQVHNASAKQVQFFTPAVLQKRPIGATLPRTANNG